MNTEIKNLVHDFGGKNFNEFVTYVYTIFQRQIDSSKKKYDRDKYNKIRQSILQYIIANEKIITIEIKKKNYK